MKTAVPFLLVIGAAVAAQCAAAPSAHVPIDPKATGAMVAEEVCSTCHGPAGMAALSNVPNLAGQHEEYVAKQLREFKARTRSDPNAVESMWIISHKLTEKQIDQLAAHFAAQQPQVQPVEGKAEQIALGKTIFTGGALARGIPPCSGCHGTDGVGKTIFPRLAGQHTDYLVKQLMVFQTTQQRPGASVMKSVSHELTPEDMLSVAAFLQALPHEKAP